MQEKKIKLRQNNQKMINAYAVLAKGICESCTAQLISISQLFNMPYKDAIKIADTILEATLTEDYFEASTIRIEENDEEVIS